jgi:hypothetical protein
MNKEQFTNYLQNPENLNGDSVGELTEIVSRFPYCQSAHLLLTVNLFKEENIRYNASLKTTAVYAGSRWILKQKIDQLEVKLNAVTPKPQPEVITEVPELQKPLEKSSTPKSKTAKTKQELLDEFIINQPSISRVKETFFSATQASRQSIVDQEEIVSETLAEIYFDQRYFEKAINIYEKLSLKYPEKSIYFAALIKKAKNEVKS